jgi:hypothetical protein
MWAFLILAILCGINGVIGFAHFFQNEEGEKTDPKNITKGNFFHSIALLVASFLFFVAAGVRIAILLFS